MNTLTSLTKNVNPKVRLAKLFKGFRERAPLLLPHAAQREGSGFRDAIEQFFGLSKHPEPVLKQNQCSV